MGNCCYSGEGPPDVKKWDLDKDSWLTQTTYLGTRDVEELNNKIVKLPFTKKVVNYTYYLTRNNTDVITHRIDYTAPGTGGSILYGDFKVIHEADLADFRKTFQPPQQCEGNILRCPASKMAEWERKYFSRSATEETAAELVVQRRNGTGWCH